MSDRAPYGPDDYGPGPYVPLSLAFNEDVRVLDVSPLARWVYVCGLLVAKRCESDGVVTLPQVRRECPDVPGLEILAKELVDVGLWSDEGDRRYAVVAFLDGTARRNGCNRGE